MKFKAALIIATFYIPSAVANAEVADPDPTYTVVTYNGTGIAEERPTIGTAFFSFSVDCLGSAPDVRTAIGLESDPLWAEIADKVPAVLTPTQGRFFGATGNIREREGWRYETTPPRIDFLDPTKVIPAKSEFIDVCTNKPLTKSPKDVGTVFSGSRVFGVRVSGEDLTWLEGKVLALNTKSARVSRGAGAVRGLGGRLDPETAPRVEVASRRGEEVEADVRVIPGTIAYDITKETRQAMLATTKKIARAQAVESLDSDTESLGLHNHIVPLGQGQGLPPSFGAVIGNPVGRGDAPKVSLATEFVLSIFMKAIGLKNSDGRPSGFPVQGDADLLADYATLTVEFNTRCHGGETGPADAALALQTEGGVATTRIAELRAYQKEHGEKRFTEFEDPDSDEAKEFQKKNRLEVELLQGPFEEFPYRPLAYDETDPKFPVTMYMNTCTLDSVQAPDSGRITDLPSFWRVSQLATLRSDKFDKILDKSEKLQNELDASQKARDGVFVETSDPVASVTESTQRKLERLVRTDAIKQGLQQPLPDALALDDYVEAYFRSLDPVGFGFGTGPILASAANASETANSRDSLAVEVVIRDNERPLIKMLRNYAFSWEVRSQNYAQDPEGERDERAERAGRTVAQTDVPSTAQSRIQAQVQAFRDALENAQQ